MLTSQVIKAGTPKMKNKVVRHIEVFKERGETDELAKKRFMKMYNITDQEISSGEVVLKIFDQDKMFVTNRTYKKKN